MKPIIYIETKENGYIFKMALKPYFEYGYETRAKYRVVYQYYKDTFLGRLFKTWHNLEYCLCMDGTVSWHYREESYRTHRNQLIDLYGSIEKIWAYQKRQKDEAERYSKQSYEAYLERTTHTHLKHKRND